MILIKWFKHDCDMHTDFKIQILIEKHGLEGYAIWNLCLEILGKEGHLGRIDSQLRWKEGILKVAGWSLNGNDKDKLDAILNTMAEINLINPKSFKFGNLYIPKFIKRADEYTMRKIGRMSGEYPDNVHAEQNRIDKNRIDSIVLHYIKEKRWGESIKENQSLQSDIFKRNVKPAKQLLVVANNDTLAIKAISIMAKEYEEKKLSWTLETVIKHFPELIYPSKPRVIKI